MSAAYLRRWSLGETWQTRAKPQSDDRKPVTLKNGYGFPKRELVREAAPDFSRRYRLDVLYGIPYLELIPTDTNPWSHTPPDGLLAVVTRRRIIVSGLAKYVALSDRARSEPRMVARLRETLGKGVTEMLQTA